MTKTIVNEAGTFIIEVIVKRLTRIDIKVTNDGEIQHNVSAGSIEWTIKEIEKVEEMIRYKGEVAKGIQDKLSPIIDQLKQLGFSE
jgi:hypothetical protein